MYSNTKVPTPRFKLEEDVIKRNNSLLIGYNCLHCGLFNEITLNLYLRKVKNKIVCCDGCKNLDEHKRATHVAYMKGGREVASTERTWSEKTLTERVSESDTLFALEDTAFQTAYGLAHFSKDEFERIRSKIISVGNGKLKDLSGWEYLPHFKIWNQSKYTPMLINPTTNAIEKPNYIQWSCEVCESHFTNRDLEVQKNRVKILCAECGFCNRIFKVKSMNTPWGKIRYQSHPEYNFVRWCIENNIHVTNGPSIEYVWKERTHKYRVDFQIAAHKKLVEIKDNHVWHKIQIENGKWGAKEQIAKKWCEDNGWEYDIIFPKTLASWKESTLKMKGL